MIPTGGFLPEAKNNGGAISASELPIPFDGVYTEGGDGTIGKASTLGFSQAGILFTGSIVDELFGTGLHNDKTMRITLRQPKVFGVLLLDSFTPPLVGYEFFDVDAYVQDVCLAPAYTVEDPAYAGCLVGETKGQTKVDGENVSFTVIS